jgi:hypothetical protein
MPEWLSSVATISLIVAGVCALVISVHLVQGGAKGGQLVSDLLAGGYVWVDGHHHLCHLWAGAAQVADRRNPD